MYKKEQRFVIRYAMPTTEGHEHVKDIIARSEEKKKETIQRCRELGYRVISTKKLYPFNSERNQHNFMLISNICYNRMHDMIYGEVIYDNAEYIRLEETKEKADVYFELPLPIAWLPWEEWKEAKELSTMAILHRQDCCIENGRPELVSLC